MRLVAAMVAMFVAVAAFAAPAGAHAVLESSTPAPDEVLDAAPSTLTLRFSEAVIVDVSSTRLIDASGTDVAATVRGDGNEIVVSVDEPNSMDRGTYVLGWFAQSADSHRIGGALTFHVGERSASVSGAATDLADAAAGAATVSAGARVAWFSAVLAAVVAVGAVVVGELGLVALRWQRRGGAGAAALGVIAVAALNGDSSSWVQAGVVVLGAGALFVDELWPRWALRAFGATSVIGGFALSGHPRVASPVALSMVSDLTHLVAAAVWGGGLITLALVLAAGHVPSDQFAGAIGRFSTVAALSLVAVAASGVMLAWRIAGSFGEVFAGAHGRALAVKVVVVGLIALVGAYNRWVLCPNVVALDSGDDRVGAAATRMRRTISIEAVLIVAVLALSAVLSSTPPSAGVPTPVSTSPGFGEVSGRLVQTASFLDGSATIVLTPNGSAGGYDLVVTLLDPAGGPVEVRDGVSVALRQREAQIGPLRPEVAADGPGVFRGVVQLTPAGEWEINVSAVISDFEQPQAIATFAIP